MKFINKLLLFLFLAVGTVYRAEELPMGPPPTPPGGGGGGSGPGAPASPIDMYVYGLVIVAFVLIVYYKKLKQRKLA